MSRNSSAIDGPEMKRQAGMRHGGTKKFIKKVTKNRARKKTAKASRRRNRR